MSDSIHRKKRLVAVAASTIVSLACGTNYAYSAWGPQFAEKLQLSNTQSNLIGTSGNVGMYLMGIPFGYMCDTRGPHLNTVIGAFGLVLGYYPLYWAYGGEPGSTSTWLLCFFSFVTGGGSCSAFQASIKTAALNWPKNRGTATAFPLAAFGLSAFFFTGVSSMFFAHSTSKFLLFLAIGTFCMVFFSVYFMSVPETQEYEALASHEPAARTRRDSSLMHRSGSWRRGNGSQSKPGKKGVRARSAGSRSSNALLDEEVHEPAVEAGTARQADEESSLLSDDESIPGDVMASGESLKTTSGILHSHAREITGLALLPEIDFWLIFTLLGLLTGIGLMTINNIGHGSTALWKHYDPAAPKDMIIRRQLMHVSIISLSSFCGRLLSGIGSDFILKIHKSRFYCIVASSSTFAFAQFMALTVTNPNYLWTVSLLSGLAYGALFGVYPALVADAFGVNGLSLNWGFMTVAPVIFGNAFNLIYGSVFDAHSIKGPEGELTCDLGIECYRYAYWVTLIASLVSICISLLTVWRDGRKLHRAREISEGRLD